MRSIDQSVVANRLTVERFSPYLAAAGGDLPVAFGLYDWNLRVAGSFHEDLGRLEIVFRNAIDSTLVAHGSSEGWPTAWYKRPQLFSANARARNDIDVARRRATARGRGETHSQVIAEFSFGFWRYLCSVSYLTSLWVPALGSAFPRHPRAGNPRVVRVDVEDRMQRLHFLRNRIAHHEPIHRRDLRHDLDGLVELVGWICADTQTWIICESRSGAVLKTRPQSTEGR